MKLTYDNCDKLKLGKSGNIISRKYYIRYEVSTCIVCGELFLNQVGKCKICSIECRTKHINNMRGKPKTEDCPSCGRQMKRGRKLCVDCSVDYYQGENCSNWRGGYSSNLIPTYDNLFSRLHPIEEVRRSPIDENILEVKCTYCGRWFTPILHQVFNRIKYINKCGDSSRFYCSESCKSACPMYRTRSLFKNRKSREVYPDLRKLVFARDSYKCQICNSENKIQCHHIKPSVKNPIEDADMDNCITLCKECHKKIHSKEGCKYHQLRCNNK